MSEYIEEIRRIIADNVRKYRKLAGLTQKELANEINKRSGADVKNHNISSWEKYVNSIDNAYISIIAEILKVTPNDIYGWDDPKLKSIRQSYSLTVAEEEQVYDYIDYIKYRRK